jgi:TonB-linked SusC/RagA family outer membrane protein
MMKTYPTTHISRRYALTLLALFALTLQTIAQQLHGTVTDGHTGEPIIGAAISLRTTGQGKALAITDVNGNFAVGVKEFPATLVINYTGYKPEELDVFEVTTDNLEIQLTESFLGLNEVVVTALGISKEKKALGYSQQNISADMLTRAQDNNLLNNLSGKVSGLRITGSQGDLGSSRIVIRGETSIAGENQPLFVVDGIPVDNSQLNSQNVGRDFKNAIADLNPDDIDNITVLKGPNASAIYGSRAAHGAIIITTKKGKSQKGLGITVTSSNKLSFAATLPDYQNRFGQGADGQFSYVDGRGGGVNDGVDESWGPRLDTGLLIPQFDSPVDANGYRTPTPWVSHPGNVRHFFRTGFSTNNGISIQQADDRYQFRVGYNYEKTTSIVPGADTRKSNIMVNTDYNVARWLTVGATGNYIIYTAPSLPGQSGRNNMTMLQFIWNGRQIDMNSIKADYSRNWNSSYYSNPYWTTTYNTQQQERHRLIGDLHAVFHIAHGLDLRLKTSTDWYSDRRKARVKWGTSGTPYGSYAEDAYTVKELNSEALVTYTRQLSHDFSLDALAGFNVRNKQYENNYQSAPRLAVADLYTLTNSRDPLVSSNDFYRLRQYSVYGSATVNYKGWAYVTVTGRNDWSSTLPTGNNSYFYPSVTASVILDQALGFTGHNINYLKLRGGWSQVGSDADPYQLATVYTSETAFEGNPLQTSSGEGKNPGLKPERTTSYEIGVEGSFFDNRLHFDAAWYQTDSRDQILRLATTAASGYLTQVRNAGHIRNRGIELSVGGTPVRTRHFSWNVDLNYGTNRSKVMALDPEGLIRSYQIGNPGIQVIAPVGGDYGTLFGTTYVRDAAGNIVVDDNGLPRVSSTSAALGKFQPDWEGGINNSFSYKNWSLSLLIDASIGGQLYSNTNRTGRYTGVLKSTLAGRDAEHGGLWYYKDADGTKVQIDAPSYTTTAEGLYRASINGTDRRVYQDGIIVDGVTADGRKNTVVTSAEQYYHRVYSIAEANVWDADYVKLREVVLSYQLPRSFASSLHLQAVSLSLTARNLWTIYKDVPNIDPELARGTGNAQGYESLSLPTTRQIGFNVKVQF